jgi:hypothetical protein
VSVAAVARAYLAAGLSVIPVRREDKTPLLAWKVFQSRRATEAELGVWYRRWPEAGVAIVCGGISGVVVGDGDPRNGDGWARLRARLPHATPTAETGGGGEHCYFAAPPSPLPKMPGLLPGVDLQAEASYVVAPPSIHPSGRPYRWRAGLAFGEVPLAPVPPVLADLIRLHREREAPRPATRRGGRAGALTLAAALERLEGVQRAGGQWVARCPAHDDREPSLSLAAGADGRLLAHCFAGCTFADVVHALLEGVSG